MATDDQELLKLRALARALVLHREQPAYVVELDSDGKPIYDPLKRYGRVVAMLPRKLSGEEWMARFGATESGEEPRSKPAERSAGSGPSEKYRADEQAAGPGSFEARRPVRPPSRFRRR